MLFEHHLFYLCRYYVDVLEVDLMDNCHMAFFGVLEVHLNVFTSQRDLDTPFIYAACHL